MKQGPLKRLMVQHEGMIVVPLVFFASRNAVMLHVKGEWSVSSSRTRSRSGIKVGKQKIREVGRVHEVIPGVLGLNRLFAFQVPLPREVGCFAACVPSGCERSKNPHIQSTLEHEA